MSRVDEGEERVALVCAARAGDAAAFTCLIQAHMASALALATWRLHDRPRAEDVVQEACIEAYICLPQLREPAAFSGWFRHIVFKQIDRVLRVHSVAASPLDAAVEIAAEGCAVDAVVERKERRALVHAALAQLTPATRDVAELFYLGDLSYQQIAATLSVPLTTVKKRLYDARRQLRTHLDVMEGQPLPEASAQSSASLLTRVQFFIALHRGDTARVRAMLRRFPELAWAREEWNETLGSIYHLGLPCRYTPLHRAAALGAVNLAHCLLEHGAEVNARASQSQTPLHIAVLNGHAALVALLLRAGADSDCRTDTGMTPLHWAVIHGDDASAAALLRAGAHPDCADCYGRTPRDWMRLKQAQKQEQAARPR